MSIWFSEKAPDKDWKTHCPLAPWVSILSSAEDGGTVWSRSFTYRGHWEDKIRGGFVNTDQGHGHWKIPVWTGQPLGWPRTHIHLCTYIDILHTDIRTYARCQGQSQVSSAAPAAQLVNTPFHSQKHFVWHEVTLLLSHWVKLISFPYQQWRKILHVKLILDTRSLTIIACRNDAKACMRAKTISWNHGQLTGSSQRWPSTDNVSRAFLCESGLCQGQAIQETSAPEKSSELLWIPWHHAHGFPLVSLIASVWVSLSLIPNQGGGVLKLRPCSAALSLRETVIYHGFTLLSNNGWQVQFK